MRVLVMYYPLGRFGPSGLPLADVGIARMPEWCNEDGYLKSGRFTPASFQLAGDAVMPIFIRQRGKVFELRVTHKIRKQAGLN